MRSHLVVLVIALFSFYSVAGSGIESTPIPVNVTLAELKVEAAQLAQTFASFFESARVNLTAANTTDEFFNALAYLVVNGTQGMSALPAEGKQIFLSLEQLEPALTKEISSIINTGIVSQIIQAGSNFVSSIKNSSIAQSVNSAFHSAENWFSGLTNKTAAGSTPIPPYNAAH